MYTVSRNLLKHSVQTLDMAELLLIFVTWVQYFFFWLMMKNYILQIFLVRRPSLYNENNSVMCWFTTNQTFTFYFLTHYTLKWNNIYFCNFNVHWILLLQKKADIATPMTCDLNTIIAITRWVLLEVNTTSTTKLTDYFFHCHKTYLQGFRTSDEIRSLFQLCWILRYINDLIYVPLGY